MLEHREARAGGTTYRLARLHGREMSPLVPLFREAFQRTDFTREWLHRKYACEFHGVSGFSCVALTESGEAAAAFGVLPWPIRFADRTELAAQIVDAATHRDHRRRGLFSLLGEMAVELCQSCGISFLFSFPQTNRHSYPGLTGPLGFSHIHDVLEYRKPIRTLWAERVARRSTALRRIYARYVERRVTARLPEDGVLQNSLIAEGFAATDRDRMFHAYKSFDGSRVLAVEGGRVWLKIRRGLLVGDLEATSAPEMEKTMRALEGLGRRLGIHQILFQSSQDTRFSRFFGERFQSSPCFAVVYRNLHSAIPASRLRFTFGDLDNF